MASSLINGLHEMMSNRFYMSGYQRAGQKIYELAREAYDRKGDIYPIWGTCDGFELLAYFSNNFKPVLRPCYSEDRALVLNFTEEAKTTQLISQMPENIYRILDNENVTANYHQFCLTLDAFTHHSNKALRQEFLCSPRLTYSLNRKRFSKWH